MPDNFFTADTHFGHANIIRYCNRPFKDAVEMNETIIANWNAVVQPDDYVYHLGDFAFWRDHGMTPRDYRRRLNGRIHFIRGNHDKGIEQFRDCFEWLKDYNEITVEGQKIVLMHYAMRVWNRSHHGSWMLYGHSHGSLPDDPHARSLDVGVDCHGFKPVSFNELKRLMAKKHWQPIDHHGEAQEGGGVGLSKEDYAKLERQQQYRQLKREFEP